MNNRSIIKLLVAASIVAMGIFAYIRFGELLTLDYLAKQEVSLREYQAEHPLLAYLAAFAIYVSVTGLSIPGATGLTLLYGWFFGLVRGTVLVSFASVTGATVAFLLSRFLFREVIQAKFGERLQQVNASLSREGPFYLFTLRLVPAVPFFVINVVMGLTPIKASTFWWVSQVGMLPATIVYVYAGSSVPTLTQLSARGTSGILSINVAFALAMLGVFPFLVRYLAAKFHLTTQEIADV